MSKKKILFSLILLFSVVFAISGCSVVSKLLFSSDYTRIGTTSTTGTVTGRLTSPEAVISGTLTISGDTVRALLNSIIISGEAISIADPSRVRVFWGTSSEVSSSFTIIPATLGSTTATKMDMVFILDNTGSMSGRIKAVKDSISAFTASLEAKKVDVKFGVISFGDTDDEQNVLPLPATASQVKTWLDALIGVSGGDIPENPLNSIMYAFENFSWRSDAQRVFVTIIDTSCHQVGDGTTFTTWDVAAVEKKLQGKATLYAVSPKLNWGSGPDGYPKTGDVRWLADGYGWFSGVTSSTYGVTRPYTGTGGKWIELPSSGDIDLTSLGIDTTVTKGYILEFTKPTSTVFWIYVQVDTNGDGVFDSDGLLTFTLSSSGAKWLPTGELADPSLGVKNSSN